MADFIHSTDNELKQRLEFLITIDKMKSIYRQTLLTDKSRRETDAEHSWHIAVMAMLLAPYAPEGADCNRCVKMCLVHDLVEIYAGDTFCYDEKAGMDKEERERLAAEKLFSSLPKEDGEELKNLWIEFDKQETPDALFSASLDRLQPFLHNMLTDGHTWRKGSVTKEQVLKRAGLIEQGIPAVWNIVTNMIDEAHKKGYIS